MHLVRIGFMSMVLAAAPSHPLALLPKPVAIEDAREHTQLVVTDQSERTKGRDFGVFAYRTWRLTDVRTKHMLMREGLGWGGLPRWLIADDLASGRLVELDLEPFSEVRSPLFAMHRNDSSPKPAAAWLIDRVQARARLLQRVRSRARCRDGARRWHDWRHWPSNQRHEDLEQRDKRLAIVSVKRRPRWRVRRGRRRRQARRSALPPAISSSYCARIAATRPSRSERLPWRLSISSMAARPSTAGPSSSNSRVRPGARMAAR